MYPNRLLDCMSLQLLYPPPASTSAATVVNHAITSPPSDTVDFCSQRTDAVVLKVKRHNLTKTRTPDLFSLSFIMLSNEFRIYLMCVL